MNASSLETLSVQQQQEYAPRSIAVPIAYSELALQVFVFSIAYAVLVLRWVVPLLRRGLRRQSFWSAMSERPGQVLTSQAEETVLSLALSLHHLVGGSVMLLGQLKEDPALWVTGLAVEIGFEVVDVGCLLMGAWPYPIIQPRLRALTLVHHVPGLLAAPQMVMYGFHESKHLQEIGWALLLAGGVSLLTDGVKQTRSLESELGQWLILHVVNMMGVAFARFYVFPSAAYALLMDCYASSPKWVSALCVLGIGAMTVFNVVVGAILSEKLVRNGVAYVKHGGVVKSESGMKKTKTA